MSILVKSYDTLACRSECDQVVYHLELTAKDSVTKKEYVVALSFADGMQDLGRVDSQLVCATLAAGDRERFLDVLRWNKRVVVKWSAREDGTLELIQLIGCGCKPGIDPLA